MHILVNCRATLCYGSKYKSNIKKKDRCVDFCDKPFQIKYINFLFKEREVIGTLVL